MSEAIKVGDRVQWVDGFSWEHGPSQARERTRQGKVITITATSCYVRTRRSGKPLLVALGKLTKVEVTP